MSGPFWDYWYFHVPNYVIGAVMWTLLGRFLLGLIVPHDWHNYIWRFFVTVTDPILAITDRLTVRFIHPALLPLVAAFVLFVLRYLFWLVLFRFGIAPPVNAGAAG